MLRAEADKYDESIALSINPSTSITDQDKSINQAEPSSKLGLMFSMLADEMSLFDRGICHSVRLAGRGKDSYIKLSRRRTLKALENDGKIRRNKSQIIKLTQPSLMLQ